MLSRMFFVDRFYTSHIGCKLEAATAIGSSPNGAVSCSEEHGSLKEIKYFSQSQNIGPGPGQVW